MSSSYCLKVKMGDMTQLVSFSDFDFWYNAAAGDMAAISLLTPFFLGQNFWYSKIPAPYQLVYTPRRSLPVTDSDTFVGAIALDPDFDAVAAGQQEVPPTPNQLSFAGFNFELLKNGLLSGFGNYLRGYGMEANGMYEAVEAAQDWAALEKVFADYRALGATDLTVKKEIVKFQILRCTEADITAIESEYGTPTTAYTDVFDDAKRCLNNLSSELKDQGFDVASINDDVIEITSHYKVDMAWGEYLYLSDDGYNYISITNTPL